MKLTTHGSKRTALRSPDIASSDRSGQQFDIYRTPENAVLVVIQSDFLDAMMTRVVVPLVPTANIGATTAHLNSRIGVGSGMLTLIPQLAATRKISELGRNLGSAANDRDTITRAIDVLLSGV